MPECAKVECFINRLDRYGPESFSNWQAMFGAHASFWGGLRRAKEATGVVMVCGVCVTLGWGASAGAINHKRATRASAAPTTRSMLLRRRFTHRLSNLPASLATLAKATSSSTRNTQRSRTGLTSSTLTGI